MSLISRLRRKHMQARYEHDIKEVTLEEIADLAYELTSNTIKAVEEIERINEEIHLLAINALIEAARAGEAGKTFSVVAGYMSELNKKVEKITKGIKSERKMQELGNAIKEQALIVKGNRLADIALTNIDIVDRSLYERASDVTWWAHDSYVIDALKSKSNDSINKLEKRLSIILDAYTVYHDIIVCDLDGNIIANGRADMYNVKGINCNNARWFKSAFRDRFGFESAHNSNLVNGKLVLVFSSIVKDGNGNAIGVLANIFKWREFAQRIVCSIPLPEKEKKVTRACITDSNGLVIADTDEKMLVDVIEFNGKSDLFNTSRGFILEDYKGKKCIIAHALSQGYENYRSNFHSLLIQPIQK
jgi:hypothetical protein